MWVRGGWKVVGLYFLPGLKGREYECVLCMCEKRHSLVCHGIAVSFYLMLLYTKTLYYYIALFFLLWTLFLCVYTAFFSVFFQCLFSIRENRVCSRPPLQCCFDYFCLYVLCCDFTKFRKQLPRCHQRHQFGQIKSAKLHNCWTVTVTAVTEP